MIADLILFLKHVTSIEGQGDPNLYQNIEFSCLCHHTKLERNYPVTVQMQANGFLGRRGGNQTGFPPLNIDPLE